MAYDLGTARGVIELDYNGRGVKQAQQDLKGLDADGKKAGMSADEIGSKAGKAGLAIAAGLGAGVAAAASFEHRLSAINAVSGATQAEMDKVRSKALQLGKDTAFSAGESAQAMEELIKAGLSVDDVLNGAADATVALAAAGETDMVEAATIASNAMNQFGLGAEDMVNVADKIAGAANASAIDVSEFGFSLQQAGAVANLAGVSFDDTAAAIALMGNAGIKGSDAGTSLKSMLMRLQPTTKKAYEEMNRLGLISMDANKAMEVLRDNGIKGVTENNAEKKMQQLTAALTDSEVGSAKAEKKMLELGLQTGFLRNQFYKANGETKSMAGIAGELSKAMEGLDKRQQQAALSTLFGSDAIRGAAILAKNGSKGFEDMAKSMGKVTAAEVAAKRMDNFKGSLEQFKGSLETAGIAVGTIFLPMLRDFVDAITGLLNGFLNLSDTQQKWIVGVIAAVGGLLLLVSGIIKLIAFINAAKAAFIAIRTAAALAWAATLGPVLIIGAAIAVLIGILVLLWKKNEGFRKAVLKIWGAIKDAFQAVVDWVTGTLVPAFTGAWDAIVDGVTGAWDAITSAVQSGIDWVKGVVQAGLDFIKGIWDAVWGLFGPVVKAAWGLIKAVVKLGWTILKGLFILYLRLLKKIFTTAWNAIVKVLKGVWKIIKTVVGTGVKVVMAIVKRTWEGIKRITGAVWGVIEAVLKKVWEIIGPFVKQRIENLKNNISRVWNAIKEVTSRVWNALKDVVGKAIDGVVKVASGIKDRIMGFFSGAKDWLLNAGKDIILGLIDGIAAMFGKLEEKVKDITGLVGKFLPGSPVKEGPLKVLNNGYAGKQIVEMVVGGMDDALGSVARTAHSLGAGILEGVGPTAIPANLRGSVTAPSGGGVTNNFNIPVYNPEPERSTVSVDRALRSKVEERGWTR